MRGSYRINTSTSIHRPRDLHMHAFESIPRVLLLSEKVRLDAGFQKWAFLRLSWETFQSLHSLHFGKFTYSWIRIPTLDIFQIPPIWASKWCFRENQPCYKSEMSKFNIILIIIHHFIRKFRVLQNLHYGIFVYCWIKIFVSWKFFWFFPYSPMKISFVVKYLAIIMHF